MEEYKISSKGGRQMFTEEKIPSFSIKSRGSSVAMEGEEESVWAMALKDLLLVVELC